MILFLRICISNGRASIEVADDMPKSTISKENDSFNIFQDHFYNKLQISKMLLKYTDHLYDKQGYLAQAVLHKNEPLGRFEAFYTPPHNSGGVLWFHVGRPTCPSVVRPSVRFSFPDDNLSKHQWIFTKLGMCINILEIWFGIANGQISSIIDGVTWPRHAHIFISGL